MRTRYSGIHSRVFCHIDGAIPTHSWIILPDIKHKPQKYKGDTCEDTLNRKLSMYVTGIFRRSK